jgi:carbon catabolite-derepressing protein kinase
MHNLLLWMYVVSGFGVIDFNILLQPRNGLSPAVLSPVGADLEDNPFEAEFNAEYDGEEEEDDIIDDVDVDLGLAPPPGPIVPYLPQFAVLSSSLPEPQQHGPNQHHLTSYAVTRQERREQRRAEKGRRTKWHFGIRSRSPPMEVMLEIYRTLRALGMEWKEKKNLGGLGNLRAKGLVGGYGRVDKNIERNTDLDGAGEVDLKAAGSIYFVETRARVQDIVVSNLLPMLYTFCFSASSLLS